MASISQFPLTSGEASSVFGGAVPARFFDAGHPPRLVTVNLRADPATPSAYSWTTASGPPYRLASRVPVTGTITLGARAPITLLFA